MSPVAAAVAVYVLAVLGGIVVYVRVRDSLVDLYERLWWWLAERRLGLPWARVGALAAVVGAAAALTAVLATNDFGSNHGNAAGAGAAGSRVAPGPLGAWLPRLPAAVSHLGAGAGPAASAGATCQDDPGFARADADDGAADVACLGTDERCVGRRSDRRAGHRAVASPGAEGCLGSESEGAMSAVRFTAAAVGMALFLTVAASASASPPSITYSIDGIVGTNGWYRGSSHGDEVILHGRCRAPRPRRIAWVPS